MKDDELALLKRRWRRARRMENAELKLLNKLSEEINKLIEEVSASYEYMMAYHNFATRLESQIKKQSKSKPT